MSANPRGMLNPMPSRCLSAAGGTSPKQPPRSTLPRLAHNTCSEDPRSFTALWCDFFFCGRWHTSIRLKTHYRAAVVVFCSLVTRSKAAQRRAVSRVTHRRSYTIRITDWCPKPQSEKERLVFTSISSRFGSHFLHQLHLMIKYSTKVDTFFKKIN